jgi:phosphatidylglycerophosphate synthase
MFDRQLLDFTRPLINKWARRENKRGVSATSLTFMGFVSGICAAVMIAEGAVLLALFPILLNRLMDGLDGAVARIEGPTQRGAFLDITMDFLFYASIPLAFAVLDPVRNALAAAFLLAAFIGTGTSFLAYAIIAEKRGDKSTAYPSKGFYYLGGLTEGFETVSCFVAMCIWPQYFAVIAYVYAAMCCVTTLTRIVAGWQAFR